MWTKEALHTLIESKLRGYRLIVVANREPYVHRYTGDQIECVQPASGLVAALDPYSMSLDELQDAIVDLAGKYQRS